MTLDRVVSANWQDAKGKAGGCGSATIASSTPSMIERIVSVYRIRPRRIAYR